MSADDVAAARKSPTITMSRTGRCCGQDGEIPRVSDGAGFARFFLRERIVREAFVALLSGTLFPAGPSAAEEEIVHFCGSRKERVHGSGVGYNVIFADSKKLRRQSTERDPSHICHGASWTELGCHAVFCFSYQVYNVQALSCVDIPESHGSVGAARDQSPTGNLHAPHGSPVTAERSKAGPGANVPSLLVDAGG